MIEMNCKDASPNPSSNINLKSLKKKYNSKYKTTGTSSRYTSSRKTSSGKETKVVSKVVRHPVTLLQDCIVDEIL